MAVVALKASDQVLRYSIDKATMELLYLPRSGQPHVSRQVVRRHRGLSDRRCAGRPRHPAVRGRARPHAGAADLGDAGRAGGLVLGGVRRAHVSMSRTCARASTSTASTPSARLRPSSSGRPRICCSISSKSETPSEVLYALSLLDASHDGRVHPAVRGLVAAPVAGSAGAGGAPARTRGCARSRRRTSSGCSTTRTSRSAPKRCCISASTRTSIRSSASRQLGDFPDFSLRAAMAAFLARPGRAQNVDAARAIVAGDGERSGRGGPAHTNRGRAVARLRPRLLRRRAAKAARRQRSRSRRRRDPRRRPAAQTQHVVRVSSSAWRSPS